MRPAEHIQIGDHRHIRHAAAREVDRHRRFVAVGRDCGRGWGRRIGRRRRAEGRRIGLLVVVGRGNGREVDGVRPGRFVSTENKVDGSFAMMCTWS
jgi:hypothetical protein